MTLFSNIDERKELPCSDVLVRGDNKLAISKYIMTYSSDVQITDVVDHILYGNSNTIAYS